jgi:phosphate starvation-inducible protein PhoH and related proteins
MASNHHDEEIFKKKRIVKNPINFQIQLNEEQKEAKAKILDNTLSVLSGKAGSGKTLLACNVALDGLLRRHYSKIIITRPTVSKEEIGFLPGDLREKMDPWIQPIYQNMYMLYDKSKIEKLISDGKIEIVPLAFMRGRAQPLDSKIYTPQGYKLMGDIVPGDYVIGSKGQPIKVLEIFPQGKKDIYKITFSDGSSTECCDEHLWNILHIDRKSKGFVTTQLKDFKNDLKTKTGQRKYKIPIISSPIEFNSKDTPIDPYTLGCLLGDGSITGVVTPCFSTNDIEILEYFKLPPNYNIKKCKGDNYDYRLSSSDRNNILTSQLEDLELLGTKSHTKFIPNLYKYNSVETRLEILRGILDTDGDIGTHPNGTCRINFNSISTQLIEDVIEIVNSLGGTTTSPRVCRKKGEITEWRNQKIVCNYDCIRINIILPSNLNPFKLKRKSQLFNNITNIYRTIDKVEFIGQKEAQCIMVDSFDHLYITDNSIVTHNTFLDSCIIVDEAQNVTHEQMQMISTRIGLRSKMIVCGDDHQNDLKLKGESGFKFLYKASHKIKDMIGITLKTNHRHTIVDDLLDYYEEFLNEPHQPKNK